MSYVEKPGQVTLTPPGEQVIPKPPADSGFYTPPIQAPAATTTAPPPATTPPATTPPATTPTGTTSADLSGTQLDAWAILQQTLAQYGFTGQDLSDLTAFVKNELIAGTGSPQIQLDLENTAQFARRFPAIIARRNAGLPPISPSDYVSLEQSYQELERGAGLTPGMFDAQHWDSLIANDVSPTEYATRINQGYIASIQAPQDVKDSLFNYYGVGPGDLTSFWLDPAKSLPILQQRFAAAQIGGAATRTGFTGVAATQAERLAQLGITPDVAQTGFATLAKEAQLTGTLPGQAQTAMNPDDLLGAQFEGDAATQQELLRRQAEQKANFQGSTNFGTTATGVTGLGPVVK